MQRVADDGRSRGRPENDVPIEKGLLLLGSIEFQIDNHLMSHGTRIDPETRFFMAQVRDAAGDAATKMLDEARSRLETAPEPASSDGDDANAPEAQPVESSAPPTDGAPLETGNPDACHRRAFGRRAAGAGLGSAAALLAGALLVAGWTPSDTLRISAADTGTAGANGPNGPAVAIAPPRAVLVGDAGGGPAGNAPSTATARPLRDDARAGRPGQGTETGGAGQPAAAPYRQLAEAMASALHPRKPGEQPPYPDPRASPEQTAPAEDQVAAMAEQSLDLSASVRREVQRRLALARFDPHHFDGIFGPATRAALREWQVKAGIPATGYLSASALVLLREQTADDYRSMQAANKARARQQARRTVMTSPVPQASPRHADECRRTPTGRIVYGEGVRCDFRGLRQSIAELFG